MTGAAWFARFASAGPDYVAQRLSAAEAQALVLKACIGAGLPLGHAQDVSALSHYLMSDPQLFAMVVAALDGPKAQVSVEGTSEHVVLERCEVLMAGPVIIDHLVAGAKRVVAHQIDWPLLLWPMLAQAEKVYGTAFEIVSGAKGSVTIAHAQRSGLDPFGPAQPVPTEVVVQLERYAARTYVPATEASRRAGAGAGLTDND